MQRIINDSGLGYLGNDRVKRDGIEHSYTPHELDEYKKCMADPCYFARNYAKIINLDSGLVPFDMYPYQEKMFKHFQDNRFSIVLACRQSGKSISVALYILWYAIFHADKTVAILANKGATAREMLARITLALENLPFFLQPGCKTLNKGSIRFSNNSRIIAAATTASSIRGQSINLLYLDEFAFVDNADVFYTSTYPVISSGKQSQVIITSTMNGVGNLFYRLWRGAITKTNEFKSFRVDWWDVPGRDEAWKQQTIANTSQLQFDQEYGNTAVGSSSTLIAGDALLSLTAQNPIRHMGGAGGTGSVRIFEEPQPNHRYFMTVDVSKGRGQDYSTFTIMDVTSRPFTQVATFRDNMISPLLLPSVLVAAAKRFNNALMIIENNDAGQVVCNGVYYDLEYDNTFVESSVRSGGIGVTMTKRVKRIGCSNLKDLIESNKLLVRDADTIQELTTFEAQGESFAAVDTNHDDLVMNLVMFAWFLSTPFAELSDGQLKDILFADHIKSMEEDLMPVGYLGDRSDNAKPGSSEYYEQIAAEYKRWETL